MAIAEKCSRPKPPDAPDALPYPDSRLQLAHTHDLRVGTYCWSRVGLLAVGPSLPTFWPLDITMRLVARPSAPTSA